MGIKLKKAKSLKEVRDFLLTHVENCPNEAFILTSGNDNKVELPVSFKTMVILSNALNLRLAKVGPK